MATQRGNGPPFYPATAMQVTQEPNINIYNCANSTYIVEFVNPSNTKVIGHLKTSNYNAINRIYMNTALPYSKRDANAIVSIGGYTLNEAYEALEYEFINQ